MKLDEVTAKCISFVPKILNKVCIIEKLMFNTEHSIEHNRKRNWCKILTANVFNETFVKKCSFRHSAFIENTIAANCWVTTSVTTVKM